jgi:flagellin-like hook-associated protein FlgL
MINFTSDVGSMILQSTLESSTIGLNKAIENLTTGFKLNHAKDNAANSSIVTDLNTKISSLLQVRNNTEDGMSLLSTAEGALENIQTLLERLRSITMQASNETNGSASLASLQKEADEIIAQINQIRENTEFGGLKLFYTSKIENSSNTGSGTAVFSNAVSRLCSAVSVSNTNNNSVSVLAASASASTPSAQSSGDVIEGSISVAAGQTSSVVIDGVSYSFRNDNTATSNVSYIKDTSTGVLTLICNKFTVKSQSDVSHNLLIQGSNNKVYGGDLDDTINEVSGYQLNLLYGQGGNDTITINNKFSVGYGEAGDDELNIYVSEASLNGGDGNDILNIYKGGYFSYSAKGGNGDDVFNVYNLQYDFNLFGEGGNDTFNIINAQSKYLQIDGGSGTNTVTGVLNDYVYYTNVENENSKALNLAAGETGTITIDGKTYTITANGGANTISAGLDSSGYIHFFANGSKVSIQGEADKSHNVFLHSQNITFYGGNLNDNITSTAGKNTIYGLGGDDTIYVMKATECIVYGGDGNDKITLNGTRAWCDTGEGNNTIYINTDAIHVETSGTNTIINNAGYSASISGDGVNTIQNNKPSIQLSIQGENDWEGFTLGAGETKTLNINGKSYTITNKLDSQNTLNYKYDVVTGKVTFNGGRMTISAQKDVEHNVEIYGGLLTFNGGNLGNTIVDYTYGSTINGGNGDDNITVKGQWGIISGLDGNDNITVDNHCHLLNTGNGNNVVTINADLGSQASIVGGSGDDTYILNGSVTTLTDAGGNNIYHLKSDNISVTGGSGNDTFYVSGNNNFVAGASGDDYFIVTGNNNTLDGGTGNDLYTDSGSGTKIQNMNYDPNSGELNFTYLGEVKTFELDGNIYTVTNNNNGQNTLKFSRNPNTGILSLDGSKFTIDSPDIKNKIDIYGNNNTINGGALADVITVQSGSNNTINGGAGNDNLVLNSENNSLFGGEGDDTLTLNASTNLEVNGGAGNDTLNIISNNNTNIVSGAGDDNIKVSGTGNNIEAGSGNNSITLNAGNNTVIAGDGNNSFKVGSDNNTITAGNGKNNIGISGSGNTLTSGNSSGTVNINGDNNDVTLLDGKNNIVINGNANTYTGGKDVDTIKISGDDNYAEGGGADDKFTVVKGHNNTVDGNEGTRNTLRDYGVDTTYSNIMKIINQPFELNIKVDIGSGDDKYISTSLNLELYDFSVDLTTPDSARTALDMIDEMLSNVSSQLVNIGAAINRLELVLDEQNIKIENMISTRSTLRDADVAKESANYIRYQILQQASATLMSATRNLNAQNVLGLIGQL